MTARETELRRLVREGLTAERKALPPVLFYDARGSALFEQITRLPEYYLTRTEQRILQESALELAALATARAEGPIAVLELGAGSATKTALLLDALVREGRDVTYVPADVSPTALREARAGLADRLPGVRVVPREASHEQALAELAGWRGTLIVVFLGSSIGNYDDGDAATLLTAARDAIGETGALVLGADRVKPREVLLPAYDDAAGVTAEFNKNVLVRINRELGADFDPARFAHVALWNEAACAIEMHLESLAPQVARLGVLGLEIRFARGERIHTESSHKYTDLRLARLFERARLACAGRARDARGWFSVEIARRA